MPWRSNTGQPFRSSSVDSAVEEKSQDAMDPDLNSLSFQEVLNKTRLETEDDASHDFDANDGHDEHFEELLHEKGSVLDTTDYDSDFCESGGVTSVQVSDASSSSVVSSNSMSNLIEKAVAQNSAMASMVFPWERGIFKDLFRHDSFPTMAATVPLENSIGKAGPICAEDVQECVLEKPHVLCEHVFMRAVANVSDESVVERRNNQSEHAITKWLCVLQAYLLASSTGRQIVHLGKNMLQSERQGQEKGTDPAVAWPVSLHTLGHPRNGNHLLLAPDFVTGLVVFAMRILCRCGFRPTGPRRYYTSCNTRKIPIELPTHLGWTRRRPRLILKSSGRRQGPTGECSSRWGNYRDGDKESNIRMLTGTIKAGLDTAAC